MGECETNLQLREAYVCIKSIINLDNLSENVYPLAQVGKLPHVAYAMEQRWRLRAIVADLVDCAFA